MERLLKDLCLLPAETEWVEFKQNNINPEKIGQNISALSNSATLVRQPFGYIVWGVDDNSHELVGTSFDPRTKKKGNVPLEHWLLSLLNPKLNIQFKKIIIEGKNIVLLQIPAAYQHPVSFSGKKFIRVGSSTTALTFYPEKEKSLWRLLDSIPFESVVIKKNITIDEVLRLLEWEAYYTLLQKSPFYNESMIVSDFIADGFIIKENSNRYAITHLGAILFAKNLKVFPELERKSVRVIFYHGNNRIHGGKELSGTKGYAVGFSGLITYIMSHLYTQEIYEGAFRKEVSIFPELAIRELIANAIIHQDFSAKGTNPMVEIFSDRIEITNPGKPLISTLQFVNSPPKSRNERMAALMRRFGLCEERGSGIDKVVEQTEINQLPAPLFESMGDFTRVTIFAPKPFPDMDMEEKVRACYLHCCLQFEQRKKLTNESLRKRFGLPNNKNLSSQVSKIIASTIDEGLIILAKDTESRRFRSYIPAWNQN